MSVEQFHTPVPLPIIANEDDSTFSDQAFRELFNGDLVNPYLFSQNVRSVSLNDFIELEKDRDKVADEFFQQAKNFKKATFGAFMDLTQVNQKPNMVIYVNQTAVHGMPTYINLLTNALLHKLTGNKDLSITTVNHPFPLTEFQLKIAETSQAIFTVIYLTQAVAFVPAAFISFIVSERVTKAKHQQLISGVSISAYCKIFF